jgi:tRNA/tmRNA/rRNA uracil-C5-methylase (TrmA/RlmC/RlmD family)
MLKRAGTTSDSIVAVVDPPRAGLHPKAVQASVAKFSVIFTVH